MTHEELLEKIVNYPDIIVFEQHYRALRAVVELHNPTDNGFWCELCISSAYEYPCPTIEAIEKELQ